MENKTEQQNNLEREKLLELNRIFLPKFDPVTGEAFWKNYEKIIAFTGRLFETYGKEKVINTKLFHILARTPGIGNDSLAFSTADFDFEGEDSIEKFIREL